MRSLAPLALALATACGQAPCPAGFELRGDYCLSEDAPSDSEYLFQGDTTPNVPTVVGGASAPRAKLAFGAPCAQDDECPFPTDRCFRPAGVADGFCTASGCDADLDVCPAGWACTEVGAAEPWVCTP